MIIRKWHYYSFSVRKKLQVILYEKYRSDMSVLVMSSSLPVWNVLAITLKKHILLYQQQTIKKVDVQCCLSII